VTDLVADISSDAVMEIISPDIIGDGAGGIFACLCCQQECTWIDEDSCGICEACLTP
jgi:hypothetical protein